MWLFYRHPLVPSPCSPRREGLFFPVLDAEAEAQRLLTWSAAAVMAEPGFEARRAGPEPVHAGLLQGLSVASTAAALAVGCGCQPRGGSF